jgi:hypothetical protein
MIQLQSREILNLLETFLSAKIRVESSVQGLRGDKSDRSLQNLFTAKTLGQQPESG